MAYDNNNVFAKILREEMPCIKLYEDDKTFAFMDIMPQVEGHCLVIPKYPAENLLDLPADYAQAVILTTQKLAQAAKQAMQAPGVMVAQLTGEAAGQTVFHVHFHILPRHKGLEFKFHAREPEDMALLEATAEKIRSCL